MPKKSSTRTTRNNGAMTANEITEQKRAMLVNEWIQNEITLRRRIGQEVIDPRRSIENECGYPQDGEIEPKKLRHMQDREPIAARVNEVFPKETWRTQPEIKETENTKEITKFEKAWDLLGQSLNHGEPSYYQVEEGSIIWATLLEADIRSGIGFFGIIVLGIDDDKDPSEPVDGWDDPKKIKPAPVSRYSLTELNVYDESQVIIDTWDNDERSPRYGMPVTYQVTLLDEDDFHAGQGIHNQTKVVHWSRVIHIPSDGGLTNRVFGLPRQFQVWNRLYDLSKLYGGSAEMYWRGAFPGYSFETHPQLGGDVQIDEAGVRSNMEDYMNTLQRYILSAGASVKSLAPQVVDPSPQIDKHIEAICIKMEVPKRIFMGSERGELASGQDDDTWNDRLAARRINKVNPNIIAPFVNRCINLGILPTPKGFSIGWPNIEIMNPINQAAYAYQITEAIGSYLKNGVENLITPQDYFTIYLGNEDAQVKAMLENAQKAIEEAQKQRELEQAQAQKDMLAQGIDPSMQQDPNNPQQPGAMQPAQKQQPNAAQKQQPNTVSNYDPRQPRDDQGKFGEGGSTASTSSGKGKGKKGSTKSEKAKASAKRVAKEVQRYSEEKNEPELAKGVGGDHLKDNEPADVVVELEGQLHGIELKTMTIGANRKITMKKEARQRKAQWEEDNGAPMHTVVFDDTKVYNAKGEGSHDPKQRRIFYRRGYGSFRVDTMLEVGSMKELKGLLGKSVAELPRSAGGKLKTPKK